VSEPEANERRRVLLRDVARAANVSKSTASRALADHPRISQTTRLAVKHAAEELDYVPNAAARSLRRRHTSTLGLLIPNLSDPVHGQIASGFEEVASQAGFCVIMVAGETQPARERVALNVFAEHGADAVAIVSSAIPPREARDRVEPGRLVLVQPDHRSLPRRSGSVTAGVILTDDIAGVRAAVEHLVDFGYRRIAYVEGEPGATNVLRAAAAAAALRDRGVRDGIRVVPASADAWRAPEALADAIRADPPDALLCYDDKLALALMDALRGRGTRVPEDVGMVGFDDIPYTTISNPRLTTVSTPTAEIGRLAAAALIRAIRDGTQPEGRVLTPTLVVRESTRRQD
jgi:LacI family transcriptional regulator, galactose operon repressor